MIKKIKNLTVVFFGVLICLQLAACQSGRTDQNEQSNHSLSEELLLEDIPEEYVDCLENFLNALKTDTSQSAKYAYFPNETIRQAHEDSGVTLESYSIESAEKISDE